MGALCAVAVAPAFTVSAQIDPEPRQLLHLGFNQPLIGDGPRAAYAFYYWNMPGIPGTNETLRLAITPVYADGEIGFKALLGQNTDLGVGVFGGMFANSYQEVRRGHYYRNESFDGYAGGGRVSLYHLFNPNSLIPLHGIVQGDLNYHVFDKGDDTARDFVLPDTQPFVTLRAGLRWGGKEPVLGPRLAMEISGWYELEYRPDSGTYGFDGDRRLRQETHRFMGRAQMNYTTPKHEHYVVGGLMAGAQLNPDRFGAFRIGGALPFTSEFPLYIPGYYFGELSAEDFGLAYGSYAIPFGYEKQWSLIGVAATGIVDYTPGLSQPGNWHSGVGGGLGYTHPDRKWRVIAGFGYGVDAMRKDGRGGENIAVMLQYNFGKKKFASDDAFDQLKNARLPMN
jgi:hypothetical protein